MRFLAIIYGNQEAWASVPRDEWPAAIAAQEAFNATFRASGELVDTFGLADESHARTVRMRNGVASTTDGPYLETKEYIASAFVLECSDEERALVVAAQIPFASSNAVEVWPVLHRGGDTS